MGNKLPSAVEVYDGLNASQSAKFNTTSTLNDIHLNLYEAKKLLVEKRNTINDTSKHPDGPKALGANEAARNATLDSMTKTERQTVESLELQYTKVQGELSLAQIECDRWRYTLRLLEVDSKQLANA